MAAQEHYEELARQLGALGSIRRGIARVLPEGCSPATAIMLTLLARFGEMRMSKLAELLEIDMSVTSRHVSYAAAHGWLDRTPDALDRRSRLVRLTPSGEALLDEVSRRHAAALATCLSDWSDADVALLAGLLARLRENFGQCPPPAREPAPGRAVPAPAHITV
ncbi:MarR family winged helix-turn-helix transcriptional regulator [Streptoverticillium reticulum]|uniref:MarR family winged helix-turn-helix transcriptional regulator n=1 Tax=Streptoverticillium reticulum TaxID=1433415 RepID=UPI0039BF0E20